MDNLHVELKLEIFSRLPVESIFECKLVCKPWLRFLKNDPLFPQIHLRRRLLMLQQQFHDVQNVEDFSQSQSSSSSGIDFIYLKYCSQLWYGKYDKNDDDDEHSLRGLKKINHPNIPLGHFKWQNYNVFIASCNGLICCSITHHGIEDPIYICNPITREFAYLPRFVIRDENYSSKKHTMVWGFGYNPSTNEYKVVRIFYPNHRHQVPQVGRVQVYTLGDGNGWRDKGEVTTYSIIPGRRGILMNGEIHWLVNKWKIVAFNLAFEEFHLIASPPIVDDGGYDNRQLCVMGRWLCLSHYVPIDSRVDLWLLKKKTSSTSYDDMNEKVEFHRGGVWIKEFTIRINDPIYPIGLTKRGQILFTKFGYRRFLCIYDLKTATIEELEELDTNFCSKTAIPHINSFISLKALGEKCRRRKKIV